MSAPDKSLDTYNKAADQQAASDKVQSNGK